MTFSTPCIIVSFSNKRTRFIYYQHTFLIVRLTCVTSFQLIAIFTGEKSEALLAFSFYTNGMKLLSYKQSKSPDMMHCLHGIRAISTQWVVLGHSYMMYMKLPARNMAEYGAVKVTLECVIRLRNFSNCFHFQFLTRYHNMVVMSALISVDTFFFMSGLLCSISMLKHLEKT